MSDKSVQEGPLAVASKLEEKRGFGPAGFIEGLVGNQIVGWATTGYETDAQVKVLVDGNMVGLARADHYRPELDILDIRRGHAGFRIAVPEKFSDGKEHTIHVFLTRGDNELLRLKSVAESCHFPAMEARSAQFYRSSARISVRTPNSPVSKLDPVQSWNVTGCCSHIEEHKNPAHVIIQIDETVFAPIRCDEPYAQAPSEKDVPAGGDVGFTFRMPPRFWDDKTHKLRAYVSGSSIELTGSPAEFSFPSVYKVDPQVAHAPAFAFCEKTILHESVPRGVGDFIDSLKEKRRLALCCSYFEHTAWGPHNIAMFDFLRRSGFAIVNVHALGAPALVDYHCQNAIDYSILKLNEGYDFGSWQVAVAKTAELWPLVDKIIFVNDSCIGPLPQNAKALSTFIDAQDGLFGLTDSYAHNYHLQSYFFGVGKDEASRHVLLDFFLTLIPTSQKADTIKIGELALGVKMTSSGITPAVLCPFDDVTAVWMETLPLIQQAMRDLLPINSELRLRTWSEYYDGVIERMSQGLLPNPTHTFWHPLVHHFHHPFIKRELLFRNPTRLPDRMLVLQFLHDTCPEIYAQVIELIRRGNVPTPPAIWRVKAHELGAWSGQEVAENKRQSPQTPEVSVKQRRRTG